MCGGVGDILTPKCLYFCCSTRIDPSNAFRLVVNSSQYTTILEYENLDIDAQNHVLWIDGSTVYNLDNFVEEMTGRIFLGPCQKFVVWGLDQESDTEWKVSRNDQFVEMVNARWDVKTVCLSCEVVDKYGYEKCTTSIVAEQSSAHATSGVTNASIVEQSKAVGNTCSSANQEPQAEEVDWDALIIVSELDRDANVVVNEEAVYEAFGFKDADKATEAKADTTIPVPTAEMQANMTDAAIPVDDNDPTEPLIDWDRDNPDMPVGTVYPVWWISGWQ